MNILAKHVQPGYIVSEGRGKGLKVDTVEPCPTERANVHIFTADRRGMCFHGDQELILIAQPATEQRTAIRKPVQGQRKPKRQRKDRIA